MGFQIVSRSLGPQVLTKTAMGESEMTLNVAHVESN
jgi:hypothetical protein